MLHLERIAVNSEPLFPVGEGAMRGTIRWFDARAGYGFIIPDDGGADVFLHRRVLQESAGVRRLEPGQRVDYDAEKTDRGWKATRVTVVNAS